MQKFFVGKIDGKEIKDGSVVLINVLSKKLLETNIRILNYYINEKKYDVVYVTVNKPFSALIEKFKEGEINTNKIFIIDAVSPRTETASSRTGNAVFIGSPKELTNISITTTSAIEKLTAAKILIFDSISTLLFYNDFETVKDFIHFIATKMKQLKVTFTMICIKDMTSEKVISELSAFVDEVIEIE
jgi:KaiC/GvpD/RAD55 family RecA-like ATPase